MTARDLAKRIYLECGEGNRSEFDVDGAERIITEFVAEKDAEIARLNGVVVWIRLVAECVVKEVITLDILNESVTIEDDQMNWHDESVTMTALYDDSGFPIETPKLRAALEAALSKEPST